jgi:AraC family transcriptional regulator
MPPAQYRKEGAHAKFQAEMSAGSGDGFDVTIRDLPPLQLAAIDHVGSYMQIDRAFEPLFGWFAARGLLSPATRSIGVYYDDPFSVAEDELRSRAGLVVQRDFRFEAPLIETNISGGRHAVLRHKGPYATMRSAYQWFYGSWLAQSGEEVEDAPVFEEYLNNPREVAPQDLVTDIFLPLR